MIDAGVMEFAMLVVLVLAVGVALHLHARAQARARGDTLDTWCAPRSWRRETDAAVAKDVAGRVTQGLDGRAEHVVAGAAPDGRTAVAVGWVSTTTSGGGESTSTHRSDDLYVAVQVRGRHPALKVVARQVFGLFRDPRARATNVQAFDRRYELVADDGVHAAAIVPPDVAAYLAGDPTPTYWHLEGGWLTCRRSGTLTPERLEPLLAFASWLAGRADRAAVGAPPEPVGGPSVTSSDHEGGVRPVGWRTPTSATTPAGSPGPAPRTR